MTIYDLVILHNLELEIHHRTVRNYGPKSGGGRISPFYCSIKYASTLRDVFLEGTYGNGETPQESINNYVEKLKGKTLIVNFPHKPRLELNVPSNLEVGKPL